MYNPALQESGQYPEYPPVPMGAPNPSDALTNAVNCSLCGTPIGTLAELELVAMTPVHSTCLRYMMMAGRQVEDGVPPSDVV